MAAGLLWFCVECCNLIEGGAVVGAKNTIARKLKRKERRTDRQVPEHG